MSYRICINSLEVPVTHTFAKGDRCSTQRVSEHTLKRLLRSMTQSSVTSYTEANSPASQMANHLVASGQNVDSTQSFEALMCNANLKLLVFNEAILITVSHPALCAQKWLTLSISLSWHRPTRPSSVCYSNLSVTKYKYNSPSSLTKCILYKLLSPSCPFLHSQSKRVHEMIVLSNMSSFRLETFLSVNCTLLCSLVRYLQRPISWSDWNISLKWLVPWKQAAPVCDLLMFQIRPHFRLGKAILYSSLDPGGRKAMKLRSNAVTPRWDQLIQMLHQIPSYIMNTDLSVFTPIAGRQNN